MKNDLASVLNKGGIAVVPTDTIYGIVGSALNKETVERIYKTRKRHPKKPCIILISSFADLKFFGINPDIKIKKILQKLWPGKVSVILPSNDKKFSYLHRGTKTLAFRLPKKKTLIELLKKTGPLIAPSANWEGHQPAKNIAEAKRYFGSGVDFYISGKSNTKPSTLVAFKKGKLEVLRNGAVNVEKILK